MNFDIVVAFVLILNLSGFLLADDGGDRKANVGKNDSLSPKRESGGGDGATAAEDVKTEAENGAEAEVKTETENGAKVKMETENGAKVKMETENGAEAEVKTETENGAEAEMKTETGNGAEAEVKTETKDGAEAEGETETKPTAGSNDGTDPKDGKALEAVRGYEREKLRLEANALWVLTNFRRERTNENNPATGEVAATLAAEREIETVRAALTEDFLSRGSGGRNMNPANGAIAETAAAADREMDAETSGLAEALLSLNLKENNNPREIAEKAAANSEIGTRQ